MAFADPNDFEPVGGATAVADPNDFEPVPQAADPNDFEPVAPKSELEDFLSTPGNSTGELRKYLEKADPTMGYAGAAAIGEPYALDNPTINTEADMTRALNSPLIPIPKPENTGVVSGVVRGAASLLEGLETPTNIALMATIGGAPAALQRAAAVAFAGQMVKGAGDKASEIVGDYENLTAGQVAEKSTEALGEAGLGFLGVKHTVSRPTGGGSTVAERPMGLQPDGAEMAARENQLRTLQRGVDERGNMLPEKVYQGDAKSADPEALQGIALSYAKRVEQLKNAPEAEKPAIQQEIDLLDEQLMQFDRQEAFDAIAKARLPGEEASPSNVTPFPEQSAAVSDLKTQARTAWYKLDSDTQDILKDRLQARLDKNGKLTWEDLPTDVLKSIGTSELASLKDAMSKDPQAVVDSLEQPPTSAPTTETPSTPKSETGPPPETPPSENGNTSAATVEIDPVMAKAVADSAERIADQVTQGQPTSVREAARDAALDNGLSSLRGGKNFSVSFMRKSAQEAAGKAAGKHGESLDAPVGESEKTKLDTTPAPEPAPENKELLSAMDKAIGDALPERDAAILNGFKAGRTLDDIAAEHGLSQQRVSQIVKAALPKLKKALEDAGFTKEDYMGGPGAMGPVEAMEMKLREGETTGLKRAVVDTERLARGAEPIPTVERQREEGVVRDAEDIVANDPTATPSLVSRIVDKGDTAISEKDAALLLVERARLMNERAQWEERLSDKDQVETARQRLTEIENEMNRLDIAQRAAGTTWGRMGHMYQRMIRDDFTLEALERKFRAAKQGPLTEAEHIKLKKDAEEIAEAQKAYDILKTEHEKAVQDAEVTRMYEATINELGKSYLEKPGYGKQVFDIARSVVERWKAEAIDAAAELKKQLGSESGAIGGSGPSKGRGKFIGEKNAATKNNIIVNLAKVIRAKVGEFGLSKVEAFAEVTKEFGDAVKPHLEPAWAAMQKLIGSEKVSDKAKEVARKGVSKKDVKTPVEAAATAKAEATAGEVLSGRTVDETVKAVINSGIHGENPVMAEAHRILKESFPDLTEREMRNIYSKYGQAKFPSREATKVEMAELRNLTRLQESINRLQENLDPLKTGLQRDKATQAIREKTAQLNELLKKREGPPSPEKLATRDEAKQTALKNAIEDLDKQLRTGEKPVKGAPAPDSVKTEQLRAELNAMREKLAEIEEAANPGKTAAEKQVDALAKIRDRIGDTLSGKRPPNAAKDWNPLSAAADDLKAEITAMQELAAQLKRDAKPPTDPNAAAEKAQIRTLEDAIRKYEDKIARGDFSTSSGRKLGPDTAKVAALKEIRDARKAAYDAAKKAGKPILTPEERYNATRLKAVQKRLSELEAKTAAGDFSKPAKKYPPFKSKELQDLEFKLQEAKNAATEGALKARLANRTKGERALDTTKEAWHTMRALMTGGELSGVLRQGKFALLSRPLVTAKGAVPAMLRTAVPDFVRKLAGSKSTSAATEHAIISEVQSRPNANVYKQSGLEITDPHNFSEAQLEGNYRSRWANKIPLIAESGRAYSTFLVRLRADVFDVLYNKLQSREGPVSLEQAKALATYVNESTGAGSLGKAGQKAAEVLNYTFFAPKFVASRFQMLAGHAMWKGDMATRKIIAAEYARVLGSAAVMYGLYSLLGTKKIETDPRSSNFGKIPIEGKDGTITYIDPMAGAIQSTAILAQTLSGQKKEANGSMTQLRTTGEKKADFARDGGKNVLHFIRSKASPQVGALYDRFVTGKDFNGNPITLSGQFAGLAFPMTYGDIYDAMKAQGVPKGVALSILAFFGEGVNTYQQRSSGKVESLKGKL